MPGFMKEIDKACASLDCGAAQIVYVLTAHFYKLHNDRVFLIGVFTTEEQAISCRDSYILNGTLDGYSDRYDGTANESDFDISMITLNNYWREEL